MKFGRNIQETLDSCMFQFSHRFAFL